MLRNALFATALMATPALSQDGATVGSLDGTLDGVQIAYVIVDGPDAETTWQEVDGGIEVTMQAYPADGLQSDDNRLTIRLQADPASRRTELQSGEIELVRDGDNLTATDEAIDLSINSLEVSGDSLLFEGNIRVTMGPGDRDISVVDEDGVTLSGDIQATIIRSE